jgi:cellulose biosynthesis protein BcsQ
MRMHIVALANGKGGVGKSACSVNLACQAVADKLKAAVIDMDIEQGTSVKWGQRRNGKPMPRVEKATVITLSGLLERLRSEGINWVFLDLPGRAAAVSMAGLCAADFVLVPVRPLDVDIEASLSTVEAAGNVKKPYAYLMNIAQSNDQLRRAKQVQQFLREHSHKVVETIIVQRIAVPDAMREGLAVNEVKPNSESAKEFAQLFAEIRKELR